MNYTNVSQLSIHHHVVFPGKGTSHVQQLEDCYRQVDEFIQSKGFSLNSVLKQTIFVAADSARQFLQIKENLLACAKNFYEKMPATAILAESPLNGLVAVEMAYANNAAGFEITHHNKGTTHWLSLKNDTVKLVFASSSAFEPGAVPFKDECIHAFSGIQEVLSSEGMGFQDILRQWNYIEQITGTEKGKQSDNQHYQIFNDVRSNFYSQARFSHGYPAATGIGTDFGGISIEIMACQFLQENQMIPIKSPVQKDAYSYTTEVLAQNNSLPENRTTPKFERAKVWQFVSGSLIFISGTAAIKGQDSDRLSAAHQTQMTIENILQLISPANLSRNGVTSLAEPRIRQLRIYVKYRDDLAQVKEVCTRFFPDVPSVYVQADVCRPELLVEIEGVATQES
jgi:enamine deaminase RidA (YjgF/YER057c/UK114 family)